MKNIAGYEIAMKVITNRSLDAGSFIKRLGSDSDAFQVKMTFKKTADVQAIPNELHFQAGSQSRVESFWRTSVLLENRKKNLYLQDR